MSTVHDTTRHVHAPHFRGDDPLYARAYQLADGGLEEQAIKAVLQREFPGQPHDNYYQNPAAIALMARIRREQLEQEGRQKDVARLLAKGLPLSLADRHEEPVPRPPWTDCEDDPDWHGPLHTDVDRLRTAGELLALCAKHDLQIRADRATGEIVLSRRIAKDSALYAKLVRLKPVLLAVLEALTEPVGEYGT